MNWNTIYITGNADFWEDVKDELAGTHVKHMLGTLETLPDGLYRGLYWLGEQENLEDFKRAVGAKLIWKYRLRFEAEEETSMTTTLNSTAKERFTERERSLIQKMRLKTRKRAAA
jgi:hypothetical protein